MGDETQQTEPTMYEQKITKIWVNGAQVPFIPLDIPADQHIREIMDMEIRDDDVVIAAYPKCGTHWTVEVVQMLINRTTVHHKQAKEFAMMEFCRASFFKDVPSPRILNTHLYTAHYPRGIVEKKNKIIHVVRNPKDVLVSLFFHFAPYRKITWEGLLDGIINQDRNVIDQFDYLRQMTQFQRENPNHPMKLVYYEDMKRDPVRITKEIAEFLQVAAPDDKFYEEVAVACHFDKLKEADKSKEFPEHVLNFVQIKEKPDMYRKGVIGDWKNMFTVAQNERFDEFIKKEMVGLPFSFTYE